MITYKRIQVQIKQRNNSNLIIRFKGIIALDLKEIKIDLRKNKNSKNNRRIKSRSNRNSKKSKKITIKNHKNRIDLRDPNGLKEVKDQTVVHLIEAVHIPMIAMRNTAPKIILIDQTNPKFKTKKLLEIKIQHPAWLK